MMQLGFKQKLRAHPWMQSVRLANLKRRQRTGLFPDWRKILSADWPEFEAMRETAKSNAKAPRVLIATSTGVHAAASSFDSYLAVALTVRGAQCDVALCDAVLPACLAADYTWYPNVESFAVRGSRYDLCTACLSPAERLFGTEGLGLTVHRYGALLTDEDHAQARTIAANTPFRHMDRLTIAGIAVGEAAQSGALRFFARGQMEAGATQERIARRYLEAAALSLFALRRLMTSKRYDVVIGHHGIYVPQALVADAAREAGLRFVAWNPAYRAGCFIMSHGETYHRSILTEPTCVWEDLQVDELKRARLMRYLADRENGTQDWIAFHPSNARSSHNLVETLGLDLKKPLITLLTSVVWDAQLHYRQRAFKDQIEWVLKTMEHFMARKDVQLAIRVHPAEVTGSLPSRQPIAAEIETKFRSLPDNIAVVRPEDAVSTYQLAEASDAVIIYSTKTGIELAAHGIPVIVAGESWLRGKGIGFDCDDAESYEQMLASLPFGKRLDPVRITRAQKFAYHFFFRRMIELPGLQRTRNPGMPFEIAQMAIETFSQGKSPTLDCVCDGLIKGTPFVFDCG